MSACKFRTVFYSLVCNIRPFRCNLPVLRLLKFRKYFLLKQNFVTGSIFSSLATSAFCENDSENKKTIEFPDADKLSHSSLIKRSCSNNLESTCQLISLTVLAVLDVTKQYKESMKTLMSLMHQWMDENYYQQELIWNEIVAVRSKTEDLRKAFAETSGFMEYVEKLAAALADVAFVAGVEYISTEVCERMNTAHRTLEIEFEEVKKLEQQLKEYMHGLKEKPESDT